MARALAGAMVCFALLAAPGAQAAAGGEVRSAQMLRARYVALEPLLPGGPARQPWVVQSIQSGAGLRGDIHAVLDYPFAEVSTSLNSPQNWCDIVILHINTKRCAVVPGARGAVLQVHMGQKTREDLSRANRLDFVWKVTSADADLLTVTLEADSGPMGTRDYRILLQATPLPGGGTFIHLSYTYGVGLAGKLAMQTYLATVARNKVGFTRLGDNPPRFIGGVRGLVERNTMRYYLAIEAHLAATGLPAAQQMPRSLRDWFDATERYPEQLHEIERDAYLEMKQHEMRRQATTAPPAPR